jgi:hypothetical protein
MRKNGHAASAVASPRRFVKAAHSTARRERAIQREIDRTDQKANGKKKGAMQAGARIYSGG